MREIQSSDAKARFSQILDEVERGESLVITRHGKPVARLQPEVDQRRESVLKTIAKLKEFRKTMPSMTPTGIRAPYRKAIFARDVLGKPRFVST